MKLKPMPVYEYYCALCDGRFRHLAKFIDAPAPPCPRCGNTAVTRLIAAANVIHSGKYHEQQLKEAAAQMEHEDQRAIARFLQESGRLADAEGVYGSPAYRELLARRAEGATDADVADLVDDLAAQMGTAETAQMAGAVALAEHVENRMQAEGPPEEHHHEQPVAAASGRRRAAKDLGWG